MTDSYAGSRSRLYSLVESVAYQSRGERRRSGVWADNPKHLFQARCGASGQLSTQHVFAPYQRGLAGQDGKPG